MLERLLAAVDVTDKDLPGAMEIPVAAHQPEEEEPLEEVGAAQGSVQEPKSQIATQVMLHKIFGLLGLAIFLAMKTPTRGLANVGVQTQGHANVKPECCMICFWSNMLSWRALQFFFHDPQP